VLTNRELEINMHHFRGNAIPAGPLSDSAEILCCSGIPIGPFWYAKFQHCGYRYVGLVFLFHLLSTTSKPFSSLSIRLAHVARLGFFYKKRAI